MRLETEVLVVGGGTGGVTAALSAARRGVQVVVAERDGALGGVATRAGIHIYYHGRSAGIQREIDARTRELGKKLGGKPPGFHPEARRLVTARMLDEAGVRILFHATAVAVIMEGNRVRGVMFETPDGTLEIEARVTVDATGDGDICVLAGAEYTFGRDWDGVANNYSLVPRLLHEGRITLWNFDGGWVDSTSVHDVSRACLEGRRHLRERLGEHFSPATLIAVAPQLGVREGRLIRGEYVLTLEDQVLGRRFPDAAMRCRAHFDTHAQDFANENLWAQVWTCVLGMWSEPVGCEVPYRCFIPRGIDGLLIGCRALSQTRDSSQALRMQRDILQVGEVAGTAAALSVLTAVEPRHVDIRKLQAWLREQGVLEAESGGEDAEGEQAAGAITERDVNETVPPDRWLDLLGTDDEGRAIWHLWQAGERSVEPLLSALRSASGDRAVGIALALALLRRREGVPHLAHAVRRHDTRVLQAERATPNWIRCLIALRLLGDACVALEVAERLVRDVNSAEALFILHYLIDTAPALPADQRDEIATRVERFLQKPGLGEDYTLWGGVKASIRWSLELTAAALFARFGRLDAARHILAGYKSDARGFARRAARIIEARL